MVNSKAIKKVHVIFYHPSYVAKNKGAESAVNAGSSLVFTVFEKSLSYSETGYKR